MSEYAWVTYEGERRLATVNLAPGIQVYKERLVDRKGVQYRLWDPYRSKMASAIMNGMEMPVEYGTTVLYLGASTGTTVSHVSDMVGSGGVVFAVEHTSRVARDLLDRVARHRKNVIPVLQDARHPSEYFSVFGKVDVVYCDIAQPDQTVIAVENCKRYLRRGGHLILAVKARSIDVASNPGVIFRREEARLKEFNVMRTDNLMPYHKDHAMILASYGNA